MVVGEFTQETDLLVIGGGPGGYHAAFRAAEHGIQTTLVEQMPRLGGVCLHRGCIPSKTYLALVETLHLANGAKEKGVGFGQAKIDIERMRGWKDSVITKLAGGLDMLCKKHKIERIRGTARFDDGKNISVSGETTVRIKFRRAIIATGSKPVTLKGIQPDSPCVLTSRTALDLAKIPQSLLVLGGGYIGLELGQVYAGLGSKVTVVEMLPSICTGVDGDLARPLIKRLKEDFEDICLETKVVGMREVQGGIEVSFEGNNVPKRKKFGNVLVSVGRRPNTDDLALAKAGVELDEQGFIKVDEHFATTAKRIFAIGDVIGNPMLAHKALHEGLVLADRLAGKDEVFEPRTIPAVVFTDPEIAWAGVTARQAKEQELDVIIKKIPWGASGRAVAIGRTDGLTKMIFEKESKRLIGVGMTGPHVGEMIGECVLAMEMGAVAYDIHRTIHPHPTLSETIFETAGMI
ncbi:MAG: dihydrolipoyl dehydrogenase [Phycisphaerae bacterium]